MKIREFIEKLEYIEKTIKHSPHPNIDLVEFSLNFQDPELDNKNWSVEIDDIYHNNRIGCGCEQDCVVKLNVSEDKY